MIESGKKILYVGTTWYGSTTVQRRRALEDLGCAIDTIDTGWRQKKKSIAFRIIRSAFRRLGYPLELKNENQEIRHAVLKNKYDIAWIDKGLTIHPKTLDIIRRSNPNTIILSFSVDDMSNPQNQSRYYINSLHQYDIHITNKPPNVSELKEFGARLVVVIDNGYDPHTHRPLSLSEDDLAEYGADVGFVGGYEKERAATLVKLAEVGIPVRVWGNRWNKLKRRPALLKLEERPVFGDEYAKVLCSTKINLAFLRKVNRDEQTTRSIEIPACAAFMLAERTTEHKRLFKENEEAVFFGTDEELIEKIRHYLSADYERRQIARAGRERCLSTGYSNQDRLAPVLKLCDELQSGIIRKPTA